MRSANELFSTILKNTTDDMFVLNPCEVVNVDGNYVDVKLYINDEYPNMVLYHVPIEREETQRAYIYLGIKKGDKGTLKFFDRSVVGYIDSDYEYNSDDRQHNINDRLFRLGFIPDKESYVYPDNVDIEIGLKNKSVKMSFTESGIAITGDVTITGNLTVSGILSGATVKAGNGLVSGEKLDKVDVTNGIVTGNGSSSS